MSNGDIFGLEEKRALLKSLSVAQLTYLTQMVLDGKNRKQIQDQLFQFVLEGKCATPPSSVSRLSVSSAKRPRSA